MFTNTQIYYTMKALNNILNSKQAKRYFKSNEDTIIYIVVNVGILCLTIGNFL